MTDNEIIKALEICANNGDCKECAINPHHGNYGYCTSLAIKAALDLINRQKAEIERLQGYNENLLTANTALSNEILEVKTEAIKEFAERLKEKLATILRVLHIQINGEYQSLENIIDDTVKEMTEE